ncbi:MAG: DUF3048 domain-containing protein [Candidatus Levybacteria bacterium]|nr:DUF3048 domain-containing protein [Candidatus Levybacteria bacterium]
MSTKTLTLIVISLMIYVVSTGISYVAFSKIASVAVSVAPPNVDTKSGVTTFDDTLPKTQECPLNGAMYSKKQRDWWEKHRPLGVMVENHQESRPQSGLSFADVIYEIVAEGGITRFLAVYYCQDAGQVGPVRSARTYFLDFISEYGDFPLYAHVGGANTPGPANALGQIEDYEWEGYNDLNQFSIGYPTFWRDYDRLGRSVATEHTMYSTTSRLWQFAEKNREVSAKDSEGNKWDEEFVRYAFKDDAPSQEREASQKVDVTFWDGYDQYMVTWEYDNATNSYKRKNGGSPQTDKNTNRQLTAKNIVVLFMQENNANDGYTNNLHLLYKTKGKGKAVVFMDGKKIDGTWGKDSRTDRTVIYDRVGKKVEFNKGTLWFQVLPLEGEVDAS